MNREEIDRIAGEIVDASIAVHRALGPGLLESAYEVCLAYELRERGFGVDQQIELPVNYRGMTLDASYRLDLLVAGEVIIELKSVDELAPIHTAQLLSYLRLSDKRLGLLINFNVDLLKNGVKRIANKL
ncbi:hypothetical protein Pla108_05860 [Botrimarina colliarenosi]|uniref:GxxExxY protein n=1 Tax=Botrimarina colliarenosi TaxID=2528001 RepID=A0A5C6ANA3_9BACT|nr:GxxExxY protein [Botrimarina colliarenosi]TWT99643.1 hypothetical protein Pla108_05860 [Botrimarina colliarenosi]